MQRALAKSLLQHVTLGLWGERILTAASSQGDTCTVFALHKIQNAPTKPREIEIKAVLSICMCTWPFCPQLQIKAESLHPTITSSD